MAVAAHAPLDGGIDGGGAVLRAPALDPRALGGRALLEPRVRCPYCGACVWSVMAAGLAPRSTCRRLGAHEGRLEYFVCVSGHLHSSCWLARLSSSDGNGECGKDSEFDDDGFPATSTDLEFQIKVLHIIRYPTRAPPRCEWVGYALATSLILAVCAMVRAKQRKIGAPCKRRLKGAGEFVTTIEGLKEVHVEEDRQKQ